MQADSLYGLLRLISSLILLLVLAAVCFAGYISIKYWAGIGV